MEYRISSMNKPDFIRLLGRTDTNAESPLMLYWTASGLEFDLRGSFLAMELESDYDALEPWISVSVNGHDVVRMPVEKGRRWLQLLNGLDPEKPHRLRILRESQPMGDDERCMLAIHALRHDGDLAPLPEPKCRIEFIGDSLTSAEGAYGSPVDTEWRPIWFAGSKGYPQLTADLLDGEAHVISQSGWGVRSAWDSNPAHNIPSRYDSICSVTHGKGGNAAEYDFHSWKPDIVVCALGANDMNALRSETGYTDPVSGENFRQDRKNLQPLEDAMIDFLGKIRSRNPNSVILWVFWAKTEPVGSLIQKAVTRRNKDGDANCFFEMVSPMRADGARNHPGLPSHARMARKLADILKKYL